jgi:hypothetical protein
MFIPSSATKPNLHHLPVLTILPFISDFPLCGVEPHVLQSMTRNLSTSIQSF